MTKQILLSLLNCSWQWLLLSGLIWFVVTPLFHKSRRSNTTVHLLWLLSLLSLRVGGRYRTGGVSDDHTLRLWQSTIN